MTTSALASANVCRAWVNFDGTTAGTFAGGTSTVTRVAGSTTATVTTTTAHGLVSGNYVYAATGVVAGSYMVTVLSSTTFAITTVATTALTAASITFNFANIRAAGNVNSVAKNGTGDYTLNFTNLMPDANYALSGMNTGAGSVTNAVLIKTSNSANPPSNQTTAAITILSSGGSTASPSAFDSASVHVTVFR